MPPRIGIPICKSAYVRVWHHAARMTPTRFRKAWLGVCRKILRGNHVRCPSSRRRFLIVSHRKTLVDSTLEIAIQGDNTDDANTHPMPLRLPCSRESFPALGERPLPRQ